LFAPVVEEPGLGYFLSAIATLAVYWAIAAWMQRRHWYIKV